MREYKEIFEEKEKNLINEMATVCKKSDSYGMIIRIYSKDYNPSHAHLLTVTGKFITRFLITDERPKKIENILIYGKDPKISNEIKKDIINWGKNIDRKTKINNWTRLQLIWDSKTYQDR